MQRYQLAIMDLTADSVVSVTIQRSGIIVGVMLAAAFYSVTTGLQAAISVGLGGVNPGLLSAGQGQTQILAALLGRTMLTTSGWQIHSESIYVPCNDQINQGEAVYMHLDVSTANITANAIAIVTVK